MPIFKPQKLYTYEPSQPSRLNSVLDDKLYLSRPESFNDVSECSCEIESIDISNIPRPHLIAGILAVYDKEFKEVEHNILLDEYIHKFMIGMLKNEIVGIQHDVLIKMVKRVRGTLIKCFIPLENNNVMWAHYGKNYTGICIEYERRLSFQNFPFEYTGPVLYKNERPSFSLIDALFKPKTVFQELLFTKHLDWSYEREIRLCIFDGREYLNSSPGKLIDIPDNLNVISVTFGTRCPIDYILEYSPKLKSRGIASYYLKDYSSQKMLDDIDHMNNGERLRDMIESSSR